MRTGSDVSHLPHGSDADAADPAPSAGVESHGPDDVLRAGGEVGRDLLAVDWARTGVGPLAGWPRSLTTADRIFLTSRFAMWMAWGPDLAFFCNAALVVSDTGTGIDPAEQDRLSERFHRVLGARSRTHEGTGIGLAVVAEPTGLRDGDVAARQRAGGGQHVHGDAAVRPRPPAGGAGGDSCGRERRRGRRGPRGGPPPGGDALARVTPGRAAGRRAGPGRGRRPPACARRRRHGRHARVPRVAARGPRPRVISRS